jgi:hypothetical protein
MIAVRRFIERNPTNMNDLALIDKPATPPSACRSLTPSKALRASPYKYSFH